jgi:hypothetical protein
VFQKYGLSELSPSFLYLPLLPQDRYLKPDFLSLNGIIKTKIPLPQEISKKLDLLFTKTSHITRKVKFWPPIFSLEDPHRTDSSCMRERNILQRYRIPSEQLRLAKFPRLLPLDLASFVQLCYFLNICCFHQI